MALLMTYDRLLVKYIEVLGNDYNCNIHALNLLMALIYIAESRVDVAGKRRLKYLKKLTILG
jgi:hypothetical protein